MKVFPWALSALSEALSLRASVLHLALPFHLTLSTFLPPLLSPPYSPQLMYPSTPYPPRLPALHYSSNIPQLVKIALMAIGHLLIRVKLEKWLHIHAKVKCIQIIFVSDRKNKHCRMYDTSMFQRNINLLVLNK